MKALIRVSLRQSAIFIPSASIQSKASMTETTSVLAANAANLGFTFSEDLLHALNGTAPGYQLSILDTLREVSGVKKNWTPLVKGWDVPTNEKLTDHIVTFFANIFNIKAGPELACGHIIPKDTFPLERYNGCPFCGTPFEFGEIEQYGQGSKLKTLELWTEADAQAFLKHLLASKTALDATQINSLQLLLQHIALPDVAIGMKETLVVVIDELIKQDVAHKAQLYLKSPTDILRYLWYKHTGHLQIIEPKTIIKRTAANNTHLNRPASKRKKASNKQGAALKLKYSRKQCRMVANWLNKLDMSAEKACEIMHAKRGMWVRFIRALRLAEYSKRNGFERLARLLDVFYNKSYNVWQADVNRYRTQFDADNTFRLLKQRPGVFARSLFSNMLWFGSEVTTAAFAEIIDEVPARLLFSLNMYADNYFNPDMQRSVTPLGGTRTRISVHPLVELYTKEQLETTKAKVEDLCVLAMEKRFSAIPNDNATLYIAPSLFNIPVAIGERSKSVQDLPVALTGTRFPVEGDQVRLFMQWGTGLPAQHLDMDLSCQIAYDKHMERCSYSQLTVTGCQHSGDIINIPDKVGTAEYINIDIAKLQAAGARYVSFTCNAYSNGSITPNLVIGWMSSRHKMRISKKTGVAYDPSCVQHQVRITQQLVKGLVFGVLDVAAREIIWLEMSFGGQVIQNLDAENVQALLAKLESRLSIGTLLEIKANAQQLAVVDTPDADEVYDFAWAKDTAAVTQLLVD